MMFLADLICIKSLRTFPLAAASVIAGRAVAQALQPRNVWPEECEHPGGGTRVSIISYCSFSAGRYQGHSPQMHQVT